MNGRGMSGSRPVLLAAGFIVWSSAFVALYAMLTIGCRFGWDGIELGWGITLQRAQLIAIFIAHMAAGAWLVLALRPRHMRNEPAATPSFLRRAAHGAAIAALASTVFSFFGVFMLTACH